MPYQFELAYNTNEEYGSLANFVEEGSLNTMITPINFPFRHTVWSFTPGPKYCHGYAQFFFSKQSDEIHRVYDYKQEFEKIKEKLGNKHAGFGVSKLEDAVHFFDEDLPQFGIAPDDEESALMFYFGFKGLSLHLSENNPVESNERFKEFICKSLDLWYPTPSKRTHTLLFTS